jgi:prepilin signal peptidase PulO-like enzyme (type II secretory pathway)
MHLDWNYYASAISRKRKGGDLVNVLEGVIALGVLAPIFYYDIRERRIPDVLTFSGIAALLACRLAAGRFSAVDLAAGLVGFGAIGAFWLFSRGRIGLGDAKLSALLALLLGLWGWILAVFLASFTGILCCLVMMALGRMSGRESIPFAPFLILGAAASFFLKDGVAARMALFM